MIRKVQRSIVEYIDEETKEPVGRLECNVVADGHFFTVEMYLYDKEGLQITATRTSEMLPKEFANDLMAIVGVEL